MRVPLFLLLFSVAIVLGSVVSAGPVFAPILAIGTLMIVASLLLLISQMLRRPQRWIVVDGSNVMHWQGEVAALETVTVVLNTLIDSGFRPVIWFDANVGYKVGDRFMGDAALARHLPVSQRQIMVSPKGIPADPLLLECAAELKAKVVTCDRFRDWADQFPQVNEPGFLLRGQVVNGKAKMDMK